MLTGKAPKQLKTCDDLAGNLMPDNRDRTTPQEPPQDASATPAQVERQDDLRRAEAEGRLDPIAEESEEDTLLMQQSYDQLMSEEELPYELTEEELQMRQSIPIYMTTEETMVSATIEYQDDTDSVSHGYVNLDVEVNVPPVLHRYDNLEEYGETDDEGKKYIELCFPGEWLPSSLTRTPTTV